MNGHHVGRPRIYANRVSADVAVTVTTRARLVEWASQRDVSINLAVERALDDYLPATTRPVWPDGADKTRFRCRLPVDLHVRLVTESGRWVCGRDLIVEAAVAAMVAPPGDGLVEYRQRIT